MLVILYFHIPDSFISPLPLILSVMTTQKNDEMEAQLLIETPYFNIHVLDKSAGVFRVRNNDKDTIYSVVDGTETSCSCPDFKFNDGVCKHIQAVRDMGGEQ